MEQRELTTPCLTRFDRVAFGAAAGLLAIVFAYLLAYGLLRTSVCFSGWRCTFNGVSAWDG